MGTEDYPTADYPLRGCAGQWRPATSLSALIGWAARAAHSSSRGTVLSR